MKDAFEKPFIEVEVIQSKEPKLAILKQLEEKSQRNHQVKTSWKGTEENPILRVDYDSREHFIQGYTRDKLIYENFVRFMNLQEISFTKSQSPITLHPDDGLFLIVKYKTNDKEPIRNNYSFTFRIIELIGIGASYEEVADGFILFYKTKDDYMVGQMDLMQIEKVKGYLKSRGLLLPSLEAFFAQIQNHVK